MVSTPSTSVSNGPTGNGSHANASAKVSPAMAPSIALSSGAKPKPAQVNSNGYHPPKPQIPLSSMKSPPLDLSSVERRGQPTACKESLKKKNRPHGLQEAPTYRPTEEEWKEPFEYIKKIAPEAKEFGLCKIIPPDSWNPEFAINTEVSWIVRGEMGCTAGPSDHCSRAFLVDWNSQCFSLPTL